ncbi:transmembrane protein 238 like [Genypterus blacodes]|uniref:transmembrane protein 238 like n=1 Tax=Genypterus blacodes TaxID=154954 RepID=UPI003F7580B4
MDALSCIGTCLPLFFTAIAFDVIGLVLLFVGIFADPRIDGQFYGDFLIFTGSLIVFFSIALWLMWYVGNIPVPEDRFKPRESFVEVARKLSRKLTQKLKGEGSMKFAEDEEEEEDDNLPAGKSGTVTWGKSTAYQNEGYDDSIPEEKETPEPAPPDYTDPEAGSQV